MSHDLAIAPNGEVQFAYADHKSPWHHLGQPMRGFQTLDAMMEAAQADFPVILTKVIATDEEGAPLTNADGSWVYLEESRATVRVNMDDSGTNYAGLATVGTRYTPMQYRTVAERALEIIGASDGEAVIDTLGVLGGGKRFFASIDLGAVEVPLSNGVDTLEQYLNIYSGHDGKTPMVLSNSGIRTVCQNTVTASLRAAKSKFTARHTRNGADFDIEAARAALNVTVAWRESFVQMAQEMDAIKVTQADVDRVFLEIFPIDVATATDRVRENSDALRAQIKGLFASDKNAGVYGSTGWSLYNTFVEYFDHYRDGTPTERALTSMNEDSWVGKSKVRTQQAVLALV